MKRIRHSPEQIIRKLREADAEAAKGTAIAEVCKALVQFQASPCVGPDDPSGSAGWPTHHSSVP